MVPLQEVNRAMKSIDTFEDFISSPNTKEFRAKYPEVTWVAERLRGKIRSVGVHAAGVVVAKDDIRNYAPIESREDPQDKVSGRIPVVAYDMDTVADIGLIKLDALGLKTLSIISDTLNSIRKRTGRDINLSTLPLDDQNIYGMLNEGYTKGVFQAEAVPYTNLLIKMGVSTFEDLAASNALVRPGAMNTVGASYINRKNGEEAVSYIHPIMKPFTENTYGVIIYQEQVMQACVHLGGMSWSEADKVRKIIGKKKDAKEFDQFKDKFVTGASEHISKKKAEALWHDFEAHAGYSFNRSHAVAYSMLSYYTAPTITISEVGSTDNATAVVAGENGASGGNCKAKYVTKTITLADGFDAGDIRVYLDCNRPVGTDVNVYYKVKSGDDTDPFENKKWQRMSKVNDNFSKDQNQVIELEYRASLDVNRVSYVENGVTYPLGGKFKYYAIKIVMTAASSSVIPYIANFRAIATPAG